MIQDHVSKMMNDSEGNTFYKIKIQIFVIDVEKIKKNINKTEGFEKKTCEILRANFGLHFIQ